MKRDPVGGKIEGGSFVVGDVDEAGPNSSSLLAAAPTGATPPLLLLNSS